MEREQFTVSLTFSEPLLGSTPHSKEVYTKYLASRAPKITGEDEAETVEEREGAGWTGFHKDENGLFLYDYQVKGMLKELSTIAFPKDNAAGLKGVNRKLELFAYVSPRRISLGQQEPDGVLERPLRAQTMQGPRVTLVRSDYVKAGKTIALVITILPGPIKKDHILRILDLGDLRGVGQWRGGGYGRFIAHIVEK